jgi:chemotaxis protein CheC
LGELEQSGLKEVCNIVCSAYLTALSNLMGMMLLPSVPTLTVGSLAGALAAMTSPDESPTDLVFCVDTAFRGEDVDVTLTAAFVLLPDSASVQAILEAIRLD